MASTLPRTPSGKRVEVLEREIENLNYEFALGIPNPKWQSPSSRPVTERSKEEQCRVWIKELFWKNTEAFERALNGFREQVRSEIRQGKQWVHKPNQESGTVPSREDFLKTSNTHRYQSSGEERLKRVDTLWGFLHSEMWIIRGGESPLEGSQSSPRPRNLANGPPRTSSNCNYQEPQVARTPQAKRKASNDQEVFYTAPSSPTLPAEGQYPSLGNLDEYDDPKCNEFNLNTDPSDRADKLNVEAQRFRSTTKRQSKITDHMFIAKSSRGNPPPASKAAQSSPLNDTSSFGMAGPSTSPEVSFATTTADPVFDRPEHSRHFETSFDTVITEPSDETATQPDSVDGIMMSEEFSMMLKSLEGDVPTSRETEQQQPSVEQELVAELIRNGPFSKDQKCFSAKVPLRARYELERVKKYWDMNPKDILVGDKPYEKYSDFWQWLSDLGQRNNKTLPEKPSVKAWNAACGRFEGDRLSEAVILSGTLDWCTKDEPGIFKFRLNPLKIDRTCRFYRRFGSDRFLTITMPYPSRPPGHLRIKDRNSLREALADWLVQNNHYLLKRTWKAFYIEEFKSKKKSKPGDPRVRVDFFAVDGSDFTTRLSPPTLSPVNEAAESHTRMTVDQLIQWHTPLNENRSQTDCKLFSRLSLALSKTWATVVVRPHQFLKLPDAPDKPVMNDGCALMSRSLARDICTKLGIDGVTPSAFQGRIAGAKGLWMVDRDRGEDERFWIQVSDSQLKVKPHPRDFFGHVDKEKITFEVVGWSKPLRSSEINTQLLEVLNNRGQVRNRVADIARDAIRSIYSEFEIVMEKNSIPLARALIQKIRPNTEDGHSRTNIRRIDQWLSNNIESIIRFLEAGFSPRDFHPLRERLRICLRDTLDRYVTQLHIPIPLSTYAYCIADPYGVLEENEVHFAFSGQWRDCAYFDDAMVDGVDVLVGRTPAHCPWDIQRRRAVWKSELRHFKDVIVFSTKGTTPLASLLSGGDYDGDRTWVCWDSGIVESFTNTTPPAIEPGPEHFGLVKHARPMETVSSVEDMLQNTFKFNLATTNLGQCTVEHNKLAYDEKEGISSPLSLELATLLSHLVDSTKSGLQLTEEQWARYRKSISPRERQLPAYKDLGAKKGKPENINDFLRFDIAFQEREEALKKFNQKFSGVEDKRDESLLRPWQNAFARAEREKQEDTGTSGNIGLAKGPALYGVLKTLEAEIDQAYSKWQHGCHSLETPEKTTAFKIQLAAETLGQIQMPSICHPLVHTWQNSEYEWRILLASASYYFRWRSAFPLYAAGEALCWIKIGNEPARLIRDQVYVSMKVNSSAARRLAGAEAEQLATEDLEGYEESDDDDGSEEFDRESAIDALNEIDRLYQSQH
ncbi:RNA-directed RNA polymerase, putative [Talaromyces stipitatus ATCC 10500]|uniref:RNA-dependent RNA polymerase n=1 Tax=Talaromyces stipitatus (strain ATCC 10500 / CBS 375.48 / QM 6759 / NRRL 1006) TaxID=441959 RepID=B8MD58_TALSN|nr:RNA-directed RNA polymerase, putative [Talaromyces stipitatus ATCC 10500]EED17583.1 RNA-directed RNA polymerase, putative [Talaromyces stipitatus ATCC 10500]